MADRRQVLQMGAFAVGAVAGVAAGVAAPAPAHGVLRQDRSGRAHTLVIGHRGASGYRPEHTLASYELAARMGADFIEPDLVSTKDGVLVARHDVELGGTTDITTRPEFAGRKRTLTLYGTTVTGWFAHDFTLSELKTLRAVEGMPDVRQRNTMYNGYFQVPTFQEILDLRARLSKELGRAIGVYPETKYPTFFRNLGMPLEPALVRLLRQYDLDSADAPVFVQSFEAHNLESLRTEHQLRVRLIFLTSASGHPAGDRRSYADYLTPAGLADLAKFANGIGPDKAQIIPRLADNTLGLPTSLVTDAHHAGLVVHPYTFRAENQFLPVGYQVGSDPDGYGRAIDEQLAFLRAGVDGLFTDQADVGVFARSRAFAKP